MMSWLIEKWRNRPDPAWQAQTPVVKFSGYDYDKASAARLRALDRAKAARKVADRYGRVSR